jgi:hypothetical protein
MRECDRKKTISLGEMETSFASLPLHKTEVEQALRHVAWQQLQNDERRQ